MPWMRELVTIESTRWGTANTRIVNQYPGMFSLPKTR